MFRHVVAVMLLAAVSSLCAAKDFCRYPDTNGLVWDKKFASSIRDFFGKEKTVYFYKKHSTADQVLTGLGGPPDELKPLGDGLMFASACRAHSCIEKAAVVMACPSTVIAVGIFHYACFSKESPDGCASTPHLTVYSAVENALAQRAIESWAKEAADGYNASLTIHHREKSRTGLFSEAPEK